MATYTPVGMNVSMLLREEMANMARHMIENDPDPVTSGIVLDSSNVSMNLGRSTTARSTSSPLFEAIHPIQFGRTGLIQYANSGSLGGNDNPPRVDTGVTYPSATSASQRQYEWFKIGLKWLMGTLSLDRKQYLALQKGVAVENFLADWLKDPIEILHQQMTTDFFGNGSGLVGTVISAAANGSSTTLDGINNTMWLTVGRTRPFWRGMRVNLVDATGGPLPVKTGSGASCCTFEVIRIQGYTGTAGQTKILVQAIDEPDGSYTPAVGDTIHLKGAIKTDYAQTYAEAKCYGVLGMQNFILPPTTTAATTYHGLTVHDGTTNGWVYPELASFVDDPGSGSERFPTPLIFENAADAINDRGFPLPSKFIMGRGVRTLLYQTEGMYKVYQTPMNSAVQNVNAGMTGNVNISTEKSAWDYIISAFIDPDIAYGIRPDAFVKYAPFGVDAIQWVNDAEILGGNRSMFRIATSNDQVTTVYEAPFELWYEMGCVTPQSLVKLARLKYASQVS